MTDLEEKRDEKRRQREKKELQKEIFGEGGIDESKYPDGWRAHMKAPGSRADKRAVAELDAWSPREQEEGGGGGSP